MAFKVDVKQWNVPVSRIRGCTVSELFVGPFYMPIIMTTILDEGNQSSENDLVKSEAPIDYPY